MVLSRVEFAAHKFHVSLRNVRLEAVGERKVSRCPEAFFKILSWVEVAAREVHVPTRVHGRDESLRHSHEPVSTRLKRSKFAESRRIASILRENLQPTKSMCPYATYA